MHTSVKYITGFLTSILVLWNILVVHPALGQDALIDQSHQKSAEDIGNDEGKDGSRPGSVDRFEDLALTPYWNLEMAEGETVVVDCGVYTAGEPGIEVHWIRPDGTVVNDTDDR